MTPIELFNKLEQLGSIDDQVLAKIRKQIDDPSRTVKPSAMLRYLVQKDQLTKSQAKELLESPSPAAAPPQPPPTPEEPSYNTEDLTAGFAEDQPTPAQEEPEPEPTDVVPAETVVPVEAEDDIAATRLDVRPHESDEPVSVEGLSVIDEPQVVAPVEELGGFDDANDDEYEEPDEGGKTKSRSFSGKRDRKDQWTSKFPFIGFGILAVLLIAGFVLYFSVFNAKPEEMFKASMENFDNRSYQAATKGFDEYIESHPTHKYIHIARARRAQSVMASAYVNNQWEETIKRGQTELPPLVDEEDSELKTIRDDVALMLSRSLAEYTNAAVDVEELPAMEEKLATANEYKKLTDNPVYIPSSKRKSQTIGKNLDDIDNNIKTIAGQIKKEKDYIAALADITKLAGEGQTDQAFNKYQGLTRLYPDLAARPDLRKLMLEVSARERELVKPAEISLGVSTDLASSPIEASVVLASISGKPLEGLRGDIVPFVVDGTAYGIDAGAGSIQWSRFMGFESTFQPVAYGEESVLLSDLRANELIRVNRRTGELAWRSTIGEAFLSPAVNETGIAVATASGKVVRIDPETGESLSAAQLPQRASVSPLLAQRDPFIYQAGHYSNLYVLSNEDMSCKEVFYLGHYQGSIAVPPFAYNGLIVVAVNGGDYADLFVLRPDAGGLNLKLVQVIRRVTNGPITMPLTRFGRWMLAVSDNGEMQILEFNQGDEVSPISKYAHERFENSDAQQAFVVSEGSNLWIAGKGCLRYKVQRNLGQFKFEVIQDHADYFVCPPVKLDDKIFHVRRRDRSGMISASVVDATSLQPLLRTDFGGVLASSIQPVGDKLLAVNNQGDLFNIDSAAEQAGYSEDAVRSSEVVQTLRFNGQGELGNDQFVWFGDDGTADYLLVDGKSGTSKLQQLFAPSDKPAAAPIAVGGDIIVATTTGIVSRVATRSGAMIGEPFQPPVKPGESVMWLKPVAVGEDRVAVASSGNTGTPSVLYLLEVSGKTGVKRVAERPAEGTYIGGIASDDRVIVAIEQADQTQRLVRISAAGEVDTATFELPGNRVDGPWLVDGQTLIRIDSDELICIDENMQLKWTQPIGGNRLACGPIKLSAINGLSLVFQTGLIVSLDPATGKPGPTIDLRRPVANAPVEVGGKIVFAGYDGAVHVVRPSP